VQRPALTRQSTPKWYVLVTLSLQSSPQGLSNSQR
jgi:hypothetical protein